MEGTTRRVGSGGPLNAFPSHHVLSPSYRLQSVILINGVDELLVGHEAAVAVEVVLRQLVSVPRRHGREGQLAQIPQNGLVEAVRVEAVQARDDLFAPALRFKWIEGSFMSDCISLISSSDETL